MLTSSTAALPFGAAPSEVVLRQRAETTDWIKAQYCRMHLIRDIRFLEKRPDKRTKVWADRLLDRTRRMFSAWHRHDKMTAEGLHRSRLTHRERFLQIVRNPRSTKEAANLAARFAIVDYVDRESSETGQYDLPQDYFRFMFAEGIEPTHNHSEQQIRQCVIDRRITQGTRSLAARRYHERMWTATATCKKSAATCSLFYKSPSPPNCKGVKLSRFHTAEAVKNGYDIG